MVNIVLILQILISIGVLQALLLGLLFVFVPKNRPEVSILMAVLLFLSSFLLFSELMDLIDLQHRIGFLKHTSMVLDLAFGPLIWGLLCFSVQSDRKVAFSDLVHLLPLLLGIIWLNTGFGWYGLDTSLFGTTIPDAVAGMVFFKLLVLAGYCVGCLRKLRQTDKLPSGLRNFLKLLVWSFITILLVAYGAFTLMFFGVHLKVDSDYLASICLTSFVYLLTIFIIRRPEVFFRKSLTTKYSNSGLDQHTSDRLREKLTGYLQQQKPFLDPKLTLSQLADDLEVRPNILSQVINEGMNKTFNDLINGYRLQEVKRKLLDPGEGHKKILALAFESGFQSKASFNRIFKKSEGMSPVDFLRMNRSHPTQ